MGLIKDIYSVSFYEKFGQAVAEVHPSFNKQRFIEAIYEGDFAQKEWKERMKHTTVVFHQFMPQNFAEAVAVKSDAFSNTSLVVSARHSWPMSSWPQTTSYGAPSVSHMANRTFLVQACPLLKSSL